MPITFPFTAFVNWLHRRSFSKSGLRSTTTTHDGTTIHLWIPKIHNPNKPNLTLIHGIGANAMWQWHEFVPLLVPKFNLYVPDLIFFGDSFTTRPDRSESFQAECVMRAMEANGVRKMSVVGISYGGFVAYRMAARWPEVVEKVVLCCAGVSMEEKDMEEGMFVSKSVEEAVAVLFPLTPAKVAEMMRIAFFKPPRDLPTCFANDFIRTMCKQHLKQKSELIEALHKDRKLSDLPKITHTPLLVWGEHDRVFPLELAHRLKRHLNGNAELRIIKDAGHAINREKWKDLFRHLKSFLIDPIESPPLHITKGVGNGTKID